MYDKGKFKITLCRLIMGLLAIVWPGAGNTLADDNINAREYLESHKIRAGYLSLFCLELVPKMSEVGMNLAAVKIQRPQETFAPQTISYIQNWANLCQQHDIVFMPTIDFWGNSESTWVQFEHSYTGNANAPCPMEPQVFQQVVTNCFCELAQMSLTYPMAGIILDNELYASELDAVYKKPCMCDHCFDAYCRQTGVSSQIPLFERESFLEQNGLMDQYNAHFRQGIKQLAQNAREQIHQINPDLIIGCYDVTDLYPFAQGLVDGFATEQNPLFILHAGTYTDGYFSPIMQEVLENFASFGTSVKHIMGLWQSKYPPPRLTEHLYYCAKDMDGYFIYTFETYIKPWYAPLSGEPEDYWNAINQANLELDNLANNSDYQSPLIPNEFTVVPVIHPDSIDNSPTIRVMPPPYTAAAETSVNFRNRNQLIVYAEKGNTIQLNLSCIQLADYNDAARLIISDSLGQIFQDVTIMYGQTHTLNFVVPETDIYAIVLNSDRNILKLEGATQPYAINGKSIINVCGSDCPLYLWMPPGVTAGTIELKGDGGSESYQAVLQDDYGNILADVIVDRIAPVNIILPANPHGMVFRLDCTKYQDNYFEDVKIEIIDGFSPYASPFRAGLLDDNPPVAEGMHRPSLQPIDDKTVTQGDFIDITMEAADDDGDTLSYYAMHLPGNAAFTDDRFQWTAEFPGRYYVIFVVSDGVYRDYEMVTITVNDASANPDPNQPNQPPVLPPFEDFSIDENIPLHFTVNAVDPDNDPVSYSADALPPGAYFEGGLFYWQPGYDTAGSYSVVFTADDGQYQVSQTATIVVNNINRAPVFDPLDDKTVNVDSHLIFAVHAEDPDDDELTYTAENLPPLASFVGDTFSWSPVMENRGVYLVTFIANDGQTDARQTILIQVNHLAGDVDPPIITNCIPKKNDLQIPLNSLVTLEISDYGAGVDPDSVTIRIEDELVYNGDIDNYISESGACRRMGNHNNYLFIYQPASMFGYNQKIDVIVSAQDLSGNSMPPYEYAFMTEMYSFGTAYRVDVDTVPSAKNHPVTVIDQNHNIVWAAWDAGPDGSRDIYLSKLSAQTFNTLTPPIKITDNAADQCYPRLACDSNGAIYLTWQDNRNGNWDIYLAFSIDGIIFSEKIITPSIYHQSRPAIALDQQNGIYIAWQDDRQNNQDIYLAYSSNFFTEIAEYALTSDHHDQIEPSISIDAQNTVYVVWSDSRNESKDIYGAASNLGPWTNVPIVNKIGAQSSPVLVVQPYISQLHLLWVDEASGDKDIFYAGIFQGLPAEPVEGVNIIDDCSHAHQFAPSLLLAGSGQDLKIFACWQDERNAADGTDSDIYFAQINSDSPVNILVTNDTGSQKQPVIGLDDDENPYILWVDGSDPDESIKYAGLTAILDPVIIAGPISAVQGGRIGPLPENISDLNDISIEVPPHALWSDVMLSVHGIKNPAPPPFANTPLAAYEFGPSSPLEFAVPITITIPYLITDNDQLGTIYWYNPAIDSYSQSGLSDIEQIVLSSDLHVIRFKTTHFSQFVILNQTPLSSSPQVGGGGGCSMSCGSYPQDYLISYLLPYICLALALFIIKTYDSRRSQLQQ
ncbi:MAG: hypothetical protein AMJ79_00850 [Phycisphaerae bacterium SM23_30]|nr:MAG: hypothetical protein AMJ79_00850 [Phycisphaerae bacterium SM23_30]